MPRPKKPGDETKEVKKRSRNGCWPCKARKVKCGEEKPSCATCIRQGEKCDYSIRLNWDGRNKKKDLGPGTNVISFAPQVSSQSLGFSSKEDASMPISLPAAFTAAAESIGSRQMSPPQSRSSSIDHTASSLAPFQSMPQMSRSQSLQSPPGLQNPNWADTTTNLSDMPMITHRHSVPSAAYPSPSESNFGSPGLGSNGFSFGTPTNQMLPPLTAASHAQLPDAMRSPYHGAKRMRMSPRAESWQKDMALMPRSSSTEDMMKMNGQPATPMTYGSTSSNPLTPAASAGSFLSGDADDRRISVSSLLSEGLYNGRRSSTIHDLSAYRGSLFVSSVYYSETETYGHDRGQPDLDIPRNMDIQAISGSTPSEQNDFDAWLEQADLGVPEFGFGLQSRGVVFAKGGYYASPVPVKIPRKFEPLPPTLLENPMNLLYFHHFLNHTARILVPHDCPENPFKTILPKMAVEDPHLLNLLLAYSACHRARLLGHPEPKNRIALWVRELFPYLRQTLSSANEKVSNANLATAIMLASLEIISPSSFEVHVPWQFHLGLARNIIRTRCGPFSVSRQDPIMYFLTRWLAYLDVLGSLSGMRNEEPLFAGNYWSSSDSSSSGRTGSHSGDSQVDEDDEDDYTIDCMMGFTTRCVSILAQVASLVHHCAEFRTDSKSGRINKDWHPSPAILRKAEVLRSDLETSRNHEPHHCLHHSPNLPKSLIAQRCSYVDISEKDAEESLATNHAYHWAGLVHLLRRVYNLPRSDPQVQTAVREVIKVITSIREGGSAMACILFPMFTAGVEAEHPLDRAQVLSRMKSAEELGLFQVGRARKIMEEAWRTGANWEILVNGEFVG